MSDPESALRQDSIIIRLLSSMPNHVKDSFTEEQLAHLKLAVGSRHWDSHSVDLRGTFKPWRTRYYYVFLLGRNNRDASRWQKQLSGFITMLIFSTFILFSVLFGLLVLYLIKSALGINLFKGFSLGIWDWFKGLFR
ncbi:3-phosphoshikimate 1-carboxyvinyltransferase [Alkalimarinus coralli]|uniref:3-phosphoshikimate 1-carboxyvinyltransferase n=1 Tax=Alkalimarinus coralli TaxID=2935863 RepID=UPI00202B43D0|nr:3-phosphoshikimate 1-carboxyvinyltransferase [Alkalimarinus coralli]